MENWFSRDPALRAEILRQAPRSTAPPRRSLRVLRTDGRSTPRLSRRRRHDLDDRPAPRLSAPSRLSDSAIAGRHPQAFTTVTGAVREAAATPPGCWGWRKRCPGSPTCAATIRRTCGSATGPEALDTASRETAVAFPGS